MALDKYSAKARLINLDYTRLHNVTIQPCEVATRNRPRPFDFRLQYVARGEATVVLLWPTLFIAIGIAAEEFIFSTVADRPLLDSRIINCFYTAGFIAFNLLVGGLYFTFVISTVHRIAVQHGLTLPLEPLGIWSTLGVALLSSFLSDLNFYWLHRLAHSSAWLWKIHKLHHSDECMNVTTNLRMNFLEVFLHDSSQFLPMVLLPHPFVSVPFIYVLVTAHGYFGHINYPINLGPFTTIITGPHVHRIHHSRLPEHFNKNFAGMWQFWDVIFGTHYHPKPGEHPPTGLLQESV